jgi:hypothetical protein
MLGEKMNAGMLGAAAVIVVGVAIITIPPTAIASTLRRVAGLIAGRSFKAPR